MSLWLTHCGDTCCGTYLPWHIATVAPTYHRTSLPWHIASVAEQVARLVRNRTGGTAEVALSETGGAYNSGQHGTTDAFASCFWWADLLGSLAKRRGQISRLFHMAWSSRASAKDI